MEYVLRETKGGVRKREVSYEKTVLFRLVILIVRFSVDYEFGWKRETRRLGLDGHTKDQTIQGNQTHLQSKEGGKGSDLNHN